MASKRLFSSTPLKKQHVVDDDEFNVPDIQSIIGCAVLETVKLVSDYVKSTQHYDPKLEKDIAKRVTQDPDLRPLLKGFFQNAQESVNHMGDPPTMTPTNPPFLNINSHPKEAMPPTPSTPIVQSNTLPNPSFFFSKPNPPKLELPPEQKKSKGKTISKGKRKKKNDKSSGGGRRGVGGTPSHYSLDELTRILRIANYQGKIDYEDIRVLSGTIRSKMSIKRKVDALFKTGDIIFVDSEIGKLYCLAVTFVKKQFPFTSTFSEHDLIEGLIKWIHPNERVAPATSDKMEQGILHDTLLRNALEPKQATPSKTDIGSKVEFDMNPPEVIIEDDRMIPIEIELTQ
ncbi:hypothetical protein PCE1_004263 [Barthelona sp. PCE]